MPILLLRGEIAMGERLVIDVRDTDDNILAAVYYHWSAYLYSSLDFTREIMFSLEDSLTALKQQGVVDIDYQKEAIHAMYRTGARLFPKEEQFCKYHEEFDADRPQAVYARFAAKTHDEHDRNKGLIAVSKEEITDTIGWAANHISIDLDDGKCTAYVGHLLWHYNKEDFDQLWGDDSYDDVFSEDLVDITEFVEVELGRNELDRFFSLVDTVGQNDPYRFRSGKEILEAN